MFSIDTTTNGIAEPQRIGEECLDAQLKDLGAFFSPKLDGLDAQCETSRKPSGKRSIEYGMKCRGAGFTMDAQTRVTIRDSRHFSLAMQLETRAVKGTAKVLTVGEALRTGACRPRK